MKSLASHVGRLGLCLLLLGLASADSRSPGQPFRAVIKGRIIAVDSEGPISGVKVKIKGLGTARTNSAGRYKIRVAKEIVGDWQVVISAPDHWRRKTWLVVPESARKVRADWNMLPKNSAGFDLELFDAVTRLGTRDLGTARWDEVPVFRILANVVACPGTMIPDRTCPRWNVQSSEVSSTMMARFLAVIGSVPALTGGMAPTVQIVQMPPDTSISTDSILVPGTITLGELAWRGMSAFQPPNAGDTIRSHAYLVSESIAAAQPLAILRQVANGLGYLSADQPEDLCAALFNRGLMTVFCASHDLLGPTNLDATMGRALYSRSIGNRYPDIDPVPGEST